jgi:hypothetical protein
MQKQLNNNAYDMYNQVISQLQDYMMLPDKMTKLVEGNESNKVEKSIKKPNKCKESNNLNGQKDSKCSFFYPKEKDSLFWCYYIIVNGFEKYEAPDATNFVNEKKEKFACIENMRKCKQQLKTKKIKNIREDVEYDLANNQSINMKTFIALCIANNINIMFIENRKCFEIIFDDTVPVHVVHCFKQFSSLRYAYEIDASPDKIEEYRVSLFKWESVEKPLKAITSYKVGELIETCKRFGLSVDSLKNKSKKQLYELILNEI